VLPAVTLAVAPGGSAFGAVNLHNDGQADLPWVLVAGGTKARGVPARTAVAPHLILAKGAADPREGPEVLTAGGGPDAVGRVWLDNTQPGGPDYAWEDIAADGLDVGAGDDTLHGPYALGFAFPWDGGTRDSVYVCSNGFLSFDPVAPAHTNQDIPDAAAPNGLVALFWDDLDPDLAGRVLVAARDDRFIVQFDAVAHYGQAGVRETCQAVLHADGTIDLRYREVGRAGACTIGLETGPGDDGLAVAFNAPGRPSDGLAVRMMTPRLPPWLGLHPTAGAVSPGGVQALQLAVSDEGMGLGVHQAWVHLATGDPDRALLTVPVTMVVDGLAGDGPPALPEVVFRGAVPNPLNPSTRLEFSLPRAMNVRLGLYDVSGRLVRVLAEGRLPRGPHRIPWDGTDRAGRPVASGVYFARLTAGSVAQTRSLVLVR
jgi:hypothetical protein